MDFEEQCTPPDGFAQLWGADVLSLFVKFGLKHAFWASFPACVVDEKPRYAKFLQLFLRTSQSQASVATGEWNVGTGQNRGKFRKPKINLEGCCVGIGTLPPFDGTESRFDIDSSLPLAILSGPSENAR